MRNLAYVMEQSALLGYLGLPAEWGDNEDLDYTVESPNYLNFKVPRSGKEKGELMGCVIRD